MRRLTRHIYTIASFSFLCFLVISMMLDIQVDASPQVTVPNAHLQSTPTPMPDAQWNMPGGGSESDWEVYITGSDISGIAPDGNAIWAASNGGLLLWERDTGSVTQYLAPRFPLPSNDLSQVLLHAGKLYISSNKFISAEGGHQRIVWMTKQLKEEVGARLEERLKTNGKDDLFEKIATEEDAEEPEKLVEYLQKVGHPALEMDPMF